MGVDVTKQSAHGSTKRSFPMKTSRILVPAAMAMAMLAGIAAAEARGGPGDPRARGDYSAITTPSPSFESAAAASRTADDGTAYDSRVGVPRNPPRYLLAR